MGPNKQAVNQFYIEVDKTFILLPVNDMLRATDYLFKAQYAFNTEFDADLKNFWIFIQNYMYGISSKCTNRIIEVSTKISALKSKCESNSNFTE